MSEISDLARKYRRALRNGTGMTLTPEQVHALTDAGVLELITSAENQEMRSWAVNRTAAQIPNGKRNWKNTDFSAGLRGASLVSNLFGSTFFSRSPHSSSENTERSAAISQGRGNG